MENTMNSTVRRIITVVLTMLLVLGISMFGYACYAVEECEQIDRHFQPQAEQETYSVDSIR